MIAGGELASWTDGPATRAVMEFVDRTGSDGVPAEERVEALATVSFVFTPAQPKLPR